MIAVSNTGPILYLSLINCTYLLPQIFEKVLIPRAVADELSDTAIGVLYEAAMDDLVPFTPADFDESVQRLLATNFRRTRTLLEAIENLSRKLHGAEDLSPRGPVKPPAL
jgi:hypothetical protein